MVKIEKLGTVEIENRIEDVYSDSDSDDDNNDNNKHDEKNTENVSFTIEEINTSSTQSISNTNTSNTNKKSKSKSTERVSLTCLNFSEEKKSRKIKEPKLPKEKKVKEPKEPKPLKDKSRKRVRASYLMDIETNKPIIPSENIGHPEEEKEEEEEEEEVNSTYQLPQSPQSSHHINRNPIEQMNFIAENTTHSSRVENMISTVHSMSSIASSVDSSSSQKEDIQQQQKETLLKKRGRKPKGGKLIMKNTEDPLNSNIVANIILHLKCSLSDLNEYSNKINKIIMDPLEYNPNVPPDISAYNENTTFFQYDSIQEDDMKHTNDKKENSSYQTLDNVNIETKNMQDDDDKNVSMKEIHSKLKKLKISLYKNQINDKKSACFWCTYDYDNPTCYIPKHEIDGHIIVYGSFCKPECAVAYLMKENIDDSTKFERYHLLNQIYSKIFDYKKNIKPASNPYYLLDKYYGNMTIQEYRKLSKTDYMLMTIDKPLTRILPELYEEAEENDVFTGNMNSSNTSISNVGVYKVKRQNEKAKGPSKSSIIRDKFGL